MSGFIKVGATIGAVFCVQCFLASAAFAEGPAVSAPNGKLDLAIGAGSEDESGLFKLGGSLSVPFGDTLGAQLDVSIQGIEDPTASAALHLFTRDPSSYLIGVTAGVVRSDAALMGAVGVEGELYLDRVSLEGWVGFAGLDYSDAVAVDKSGMFALADIAFYPTDDLRLGLGIASVLEYESVSLGAEYQLPDMPLALTADVRLGEDGATRAMAGLRFYIGEDGKTLIDRHRQDDPRDRGFDLFAAAGRQVLERYPVASDFDNFQDCVDAGFTWHAEHCV